MKRQLNSAGGKSSNASGRDQSTDDAERRVLAAIGIGRIVWGATTALASRRVHRVGNLAYPGADQGIWIKAFGIRDVALGAAALHPDQTVRRVTRAAGIAIDLFDVGAVMLAARRGVPRRTAELGVVLGGGAAALAAAGPALLRTRNRGAPPLHAPSES